VVLPLDGRWSLVDRLHHRGQMGVE
jgi:hypothetical protein